MLLFLLFLHFLSFLARLNNIHGRAIVLPSVSAALASASTNVKVFIKVFKTSLFPNLITDLIHLWYDDTYWSKILHSSTPTPRSGQGQGQGHRLRIFILKFYAKVFRISLLLNQIMDLVPIWYHDRYWSKVLSAPSALMMVTLRSRSQT